MFSQVISPASESRTFPITIVSLYDDKHSSFLVFGYIRLDHLKVKTTSYENKFPSSGSIVNETRAPVLKSFEV